ncbi:hypothetical protein QWY87_13400 [Lutimonas halocynthiae]|uniref:hypothetical protein n=1 Tax=Lutimonas halocynthiae TaxID=1446477 RepID=UPI0025B35315|nr:hypothetical protein [Lutimonas halocynthiae]MDN3643707.1 hypothetical protein [Lutimonas halocynthiae]
MAIFLKLWINLAFTEGFGAEVIGGEVIGGEHLTSDHPFLLKGSEMKASPPNPSPLIKIIRHILLLSLIIVKLTPDNNYGSCNSHT